MEVERLLYIFGSFSRKKDKRKSLQQNQSLSAGSSPLHHRNSHPVTLEIPPRTSVYETGPPTKGWECGLCRKELVEPRLLACLHSFCTRCLQGLHQEGDAEMWSDVDGSVQLAGSSHSGSAAGSAGSAGSGGSGYESEQREHSGSDTSWGQKPHKYGIFTRKISGKSIRLLVCPSCGHESPLPLGGISALPLNYVLLRRMAASLDEDRGSVLCDLCSSDNKAESRCSQCLVSICSACGEAHGRQRATSRHSLRPLNATPARFCTQHPNAELCVYCATCQQVICRDCTLLSHSGHALANASRAAAERARLLRDACARAMHVPGHVDRAARALNMHAMEVDAQASKVESEVATFTEQYRRAVEAHGRALLTSAARARARYRQQFAEQNRELDARAMQATEAVKFAEEVLSEAKEDELLSLSVPVLRRLERLSDTSTLAQAPRCELRFAATAPAPGGLAGRLLTRAADPDRCTISLEGLQDLRVDTPHTTTLELHDSGGERIWCGGEQVAGYFRRQDSSATPAFAKVTDRHDGSYALLICPVSPGAYLLAVTLNNKPIKGSPFPCAVRVARAHTGLYHCCSFCSSGGQKDAACACGSKMAGGYKGCGHGHPGHPGTKHWSCCGSAARRGVCTRAHSHTYQFSL